MFEKTKNTGFLDVFFFHEKVVSFKYADYEPSRFPFQAFKAYKNSGGFENVLR